MILDELRVPKIHLVGISYGGFVALDFARLYPQRLHTLTLSGILLTHEALFEMYQELSLRFYRREQIDLYAWYVYEKILGETLLRQVGAKLDSMRQKLVERYRDKVHCLIRLTLAQDQLFADLDANLNAYRAIPTPTLIVAGADDRAIPWRVQKKLCDILPHTRFELVAECGHVVYLEQTDFCFGMLRQFMEAKRLKF